MLQELLAKLAGVTSTSIVDAYVVSVAFAVTVRVPCVPGMGSESCPRMRWTSTGPWQ